MTIVLASASPRRAELLQQIGLEFIVLPSDIDESLHESESVEAYVLRMAKTKAHAVRQSTQSDDIVIAADTVVSIDGHILGKPQNESHCLDMLASLSGRVHTVYTAVVVSQSDFEGNALSASDVSFREISQQEAKNYWSTGEPKDKAGSYAIQGLGSVFVEHLKGSYSGVVGLPIFELTQLLKQIDVSVLKVSQ